MLHLHLRFHLRFHLHFHLHLRLRFHLRLHFDLRLRFNLRLRFDLRFCVITLTLSFMFALVFFVFYTITNLDLVIDITSMPHALRCLS
jgi:hypothetical protein